MLATPSLTISLAACFRVASPQLTLSERSSKSYRGQGEMKRAERRKGAPYSICAGAIEGFLGDG